MPLYQKSENDLSQQPSLRPGGSRISGGANKIKNKETRRVDIVRGGSAKLSGMGVSDEQKRMHKEWISRCARFGTGTVHTSGSCCGDLLFTLCGKGCRVARVGWVGPSLGCVLRRAWGVRIRR